MHGKLAAWKRPGLRRLAALACFLALGAAYLTLAPGGDVMAAARQRVLPVYNVARDDNKIAISFDASWGNANTLALLDLLDQHQIKTTFFLVGIWVEKYPDLVAEIAKRGHEVMNHSATHPYFTKISAEKQRQELDTCSDMIEAITGVRPTLFRPPYGDYDSDVVSLARAEGYEVVQWNIDSLDWKNKGVEPFVKAATKNVTGGSIILMHNDSKYLLDALPTVLEYYEQNGFQVVPVSEVLLTGETWIDHNGTQHPKAPEPTPAPAPAA